MSSSPQPGPSIQMDGTSDDDYMSTSSEDTKSVPSLPYDSDQDPEFLLKVRSSGDNTDSEKDTHGEEKVVRRKPKKGVSKKKSPAQTKEGVLS